MSVFLVKGKGWRYDFNLKGTRHTAAWFETKKQATKAMTAAREEALNPKQEQPAETQIDMAFLDLVNIRLDHVKAYNSVSHYGPYRYMAKRWTTKWGKLTCSQISKSISRRNTKGKIYPSYGRIDTAKAKFATRCRVTQRKVCGIRRIRGF